jgi:hypothetical protein
MVGIAAAAAIGLLSAGSGTRAATPAASGLTGSERITSFAGQAKFGFGGFAGDGGPATRAALSQPQGVAVDASGNVYIADTRNQRVRKVNAAGTITTVAGGGRGFSAGQTSGPALQAHLSHPSSVEVDRRGNVYIANSPYVYRVSPDGTLTFYAGTNTLELGDGGPATAARLDPNQLAVDAQGNLLIALPATAGVVPPATVARRPLRN